MKTINGTCYNEEDSEFIYSENNRGEGQLYKFYKSFTEELLYRNKEGKYFWIIKKGCNTDVIHKLYMKETAGRKTSKHMKQYGYDVIIAGEGDIEKWFIEINESLNNEFTREELHYPSIPELENFFLNLTKLNWKYPTIRKWQTDDLKMDRKEFKKKYSKIIRCTEEELYRLSLNEGSISLALYECICRGGDVLWYGDLTRPDGEILVECKKILAEEGDEFCVGSSDKELIPLIHAAKREKQKELLEEYSSEPEIRMLNEFHKEESFDKTNDEDAED